MNFSSHGRTKGRAGREDGWRRDHNSEGVKVSLREKYAKPKTKIEESITPLNARLNETRAKNGTW